ncbi:uncharacterized protein TRIADDRAFT_19205 [Trichoplax adhaerens]|uniref:GOLD domain-containing protein n=1 Tax=Trichoplax adhaerens TaxID=10228 RepID=B3RLR4_TRIAD|nr:hypothetical protein TRIADDRAFT_19205 [Trichoplax adhaerens]EDV29572.1 hypothetical protein TRIADDRAFT_19205 [Trichoplax adhaerens]|eukprot:XP_002108774.1 hypothetical protein TRIADDRAFT_19205 [Trichoplax adhaerens]
MTVQLDAGVTDCYFENIHSNSTFYAEYQVTGGGGELDVDFYIISPGKTIIVSETRRSEGYHEMKATESGDYEFCFSNAFSKISSKTLYFYLNPTQDKSWNMKTTGLQDDDSNIEKIEDFLRTTSEHLQMVQKMLSASTAKEARHRNIAEGNNFRVQMWSLCECFVMISVAIVQVYFIRHLFNTSHSPKGNLRT